ncbi:MAG: N-6 DNA methylase, partial [Candidatus Coatesbacteria bacterium]|nr:N-6 DNA methylase [Candidatus Coatesbacteria bacterium]
MARYNNFLLEKMSFYTQKTADYLEKYLKKHAGNEFHDSISFYLQDTMKNVEITSKEFIDNLSQAIIYIELDRYLNKPETDEFEQGSLRIFSRSKYPAGLCRLLDAFKEEIKECKSMEIAYDQFLYEKLLEKLSSCKRKKRGVYFTPHQVIRYIIKGIDYLLINELDIKEGLADCRNLFFDFAAGTGSFLSELVGKLKNRNVSRVNFIAYESMPASFFISVYEISKLLIDMQTGEGSGIYLKDTLDGKKERLNPLRDDILIILGNPPYNNKSKNRNEWINNLIKDYKPDTEKKINLDDDYVKFISYIQFCMNKAKTGIAGIVVNNTFLSGVTFKKMRKQLAHFYDTIYIMNLKGNNRSFRNANDENIFNIKSGVCIAFFIKSKSNKKGLFYSELTGARQSKLDFLENHGIENTKWVKLKISRQCEKKMGEKNTFAINSFTSLSKPSIISEYSKYDALDSIFKTYCSGIQTKRDAIAIQYEKESLVKVLIDIMKYERSDFASRYILPPDGRDWKYSSVRENLLKTNIRKDLITMVSYRPFDFRYTYLESNSKRFVAYPRYNVMKNFKNKDNIGLVFTRTFYEADEYNSIFVSKHPVDGGFFSTWSFIAPLFIIDNSTKSSNINENFKNRLNKEFKNEINDYEIFSYIYAILHSNRFRKKFSTLLNLSFPRVYFTEDFHLFKEISLQGSSLLNSHLSESIKKESIISLNGDSNCISLVRYCNKK